MKKVALATVLGVAALAGCASEDGSEPDPAAVIEEYESAYNSGDIEAVMAFYTEDSTLIGHPLGDDLVVGLVAIRDSVKIDMAEAAESDPYEISNVETSGDTVTWDHTWTNRRGQDWCAEGNRAVIADGTILSWTFAPDPGLCP